MTTTDWIRLVALLVSLVASCIALVRSLIVLGRFSQDGVSRFTYGWLGTFAMLAAFGACCGSAAMLLEHAGESLVVTAGAVALNLLVQPFLLLTCRLGARKLLFALRGQLFYAGETVVTGDLGPPERRLLVAHSAVAGLVMLGCGAPFSVLFASPLIGSLLAGG